MRYNIEDINEKGAKLEQMTEAYIAEFQQVASSIDWEGDARNHFDSQVAAIMGELQRLVLFPREKAQQIQEADHRMAERIRNMFL